MVIRKNQKAKQQVGLIVLAIFLGVTAFSFYTSGSISTPDSATGTPASAVQQIDGYKQVLAHDPKNVPALVGLGNLYYDTSQWMKAADYYQQALKIKPDLDDVRADMGTSYFNMGLNEVAEGEFRKVLKHNPRHINARFNLGVVLRSSGRLVEAKELWRNMLPSAPPHMAQRIKELLKGANS